MAALVNTHPTLLDWTKVQDPNNKTARLIELLHQQNEMLTDSYWMEGNLPTGHKSSARTGLAPGTWRPLYGGVQPSKNTSVQFTDTCGMLEAYNEVDKALADLNGNTASFRLQQSMGTVEGLGQEMAGTQIYGNETTEPEAFTGFAPRFASQSEANGENILTSAATPDSTDNTSIWLVVWGPNTVAMIYPKGSMHGLQMTDKGQVTIENATGGAGGSVGGGRYEAYRTHFRWDAGLAVMDWRYVVRINYDLEDVVASGATGPVLSDLMAKATRRIPNLRAGNAAFYMNRDSQDAFDLQSNYKATLAYTNIEDAQGKMVPAFRGIPIRRVDQITSAESGI